jgi:hypothetical protein
MKGCYTSALLHDEYWPGRLPIVCRYVSRGTVWIYLLLDRFHFYLVEVDSGF